MANEPNTPISRREALRLTAAAGLGGTLVAGGAAVSTLGGGDSTDEPECTPGEELPFSYELNVKDWVVPSETCSTLLIPVAFVETDGEEHATVRAYIDNSGGTNPDYDRLVAQCPNELGYQADRHGNATIVLPPGASVNIKNISDPLGNNGIDQPMTTLHVLG